MKQNQHNGGSMMSLKGGAPPTYHQMGGGHTLPMTQRSRFGAKSAAGGSFAPSHSCSSFFTRHNPHPSRVRHIDGLLGVPICHVSDDGFQPSQRPLMTPERRSLYQVQKVPSTITEHPIFPTNSYGINTYDVFASKGVPYKRVPQLPRWFEELKDISNRAGLEPGLALEQQRQPNAGGRAATYSKTTGRMNEAPSRAMTRSGPASRAGKVQSRSGVFTGGISAAPDNEALVMELLSQILQTDSISYIQQWLMSANERDKESVCDMIKAALMTQDQMNNDQYQQQNQYRRDDFLENQNQSNGTNVDRLIIDQNQQQQQQQQQNQQQQLTKLPDINQTGNTARLSDHLKMTPNANTRFEPMAAVQENDQDYLVEYQMDPNASDQQHHQQHAY